MEIDRSDAMLMELLKEKNSITAFLDAVFGFLGRCTDFYYIMKQPTDHLGFPPGVQEEIVKNAFLKWRSISKSSSEPSHPSAVINEIEIKTTEDKEIMNDNASKSYESKLTKTETQFEPSEYYNGSICNNYCWSQTIKEVEVHVRLPSNINSSKLVNVKIESDSLHISDKENPPNILLSGNMFEKCKHLDAVWSISSGKIQISLDKTRENWWSKFLTDEPAISLATMDCSRPIDELPEDSQAIIEKLRWNQEQKLLGKPTDEELRQQEILRKAWNVEGSPFKGTEFDPSVLHINSQY